MTARCMSRSRIGGSRGRVAKVFAPVLHDAVGGHDDAAAAFVALMHDGLEQLGGVGDSPRKEEIVQDKQIRFDVRTHQRRLHLGCLPV
jgi:hypothetical protein